MLVVERPFEAVVTELRLKHWLTGASSELLRSQTDPSLCCKKFGREWKQADVRAWAQTSEELACWLGSLPGASDLLEAREPLEVGPDYVIRKFVSLGTALSDIGRYPAGAPPQLKNLRHAVRGALGSASSLVAAAATHSLLEDCSTVFWDSTKVRFVLAEPRLALEEVRRCANG